MVFGRCSQVEKGRGVVEDSPRRQTARDSRQAASEAMLTKFPPLVSAQGDSFAVDESLDEEIRSPPGLGKIMPNAAIF